MAHREQQTFCSVIRGLFPSCFFRKRVLDIGSLDVNGCNRPLFWLCDYTGLDLAPGRNVDFVCHGHLWNGIYGGYDVIISTECGEHDRYWEKTISNAIRMLKPGGMLIYTCATTGRPEHGTMRTDKDSSPFTVDYYQNLTKEDLLSIKGFPEAWAWSRFEIDHNHCDLRFVGIKKGKMIKFRPSLLSFVISKVAFFVEERFLDYRNGIAKMLSKSKSSSTY